MRHLRTGYLLSFKEDGEKCYPILKPPVDEQDELQKESEELNTFIQFNKTSYKQQEILTSQEYYMIKMGAKRIKEHHIEKYVSSGQYVTSYEYTPYEIYKDVELERRFPNFKDSLEDKEFEIVRNVLILSEKFSEEHAFQIQKITEKEKEDVLAVASTIPTLKKLNKVLKYTKEFNKP